MQNLQVSADMDFHWNEQMAHAAIGSGKSSVARKSQSVFDAPAQAGNASIKTRLGNRNLLTYLRLPSMHYYHRQGLFGENVVPLHFTLKMLPCVLAVTWTLNSGALLYPRSVAVNQQYGTPSSL